MNDNQQLMAYYPFFLLFDLADLAFVGLAFLLGVRPDIDSPMASSNDTFTEEISFFFFAIASKLLKYINNKLIVLNGGEYKIAYLYGVNGSNDIR